MDHGLTKRGDRTHCKSGDHLWLPANWYVTATGHRWCRLCHEARARDKARTKPTVPTPPQAPPYASEMVYYARRYHPTHAEPDPNPAPRCGYLGEMLGPFGGPGAALGDR